MDAKKEQVKEFELALQKLAEQKQTLLQTLGEKTYHQNPSAGDPYNTLIEQLLSLHGTKAEAEKSIQDIDEKTTRIKVISADQKSNENQIKAIEKEYNVEYEKIGQAAYSSYKDGMLQGEQFNTLFSEFQSLEDKIEHIDDKIKDTDDDGKSNVFQKIGGSVSRLVFKTRKNISEGSLERHFQKAGKEICNSDLLTSLDDPLVEQAATGYLEQKKSSDALQQQIDQLEAEKSTIQAELDTILEGSKISARISELENRIRHLEEDLAKTSISLGQLVTEKNAASLVLQKDDSVFLTDIKENDQETADIQKKLVSLRHEIRIDELQVEKNSVTKEIEDLESKIQEARKTIKDKKKKIQDIDKEISDLNDKLL